MTTIESILAAIIVVSLCGILIAVFNIEKEWSVGVAIGDAVVFFVCLIAVMIIDGTKPAVIKTKQLPQIDTTITIKNGVSDTTYTYHLIRI